MNLKLNNSAMRNRIFSYFTCDSLQSLCTGLYFLLAQTAICKSSPVFEGAESLAQRINTLTITFRCYVAHRFIPFPLTKYLFTVENVRVLTTCKAPGMFSLAQWQVTHNRCVAIVSSRLINYLSTEPGSH